MPMNGTAMRPPAKAGPMMPVDVKAELFSATAFISFSSPTSSGIQACRAGTLNAKTVPVTSASTKMCQTAITSVWISTAVTSEFATSVNWLPAISHRLCSRSAATPPISVKQSCGIPQPRPTMPSDVAVPVSSNVRKPWAVIIIWMALKEKSMLIHSTRK